MNIRNTILLALLLAQCAGQPKRVPAPEDLYLEDGFFVISTYFNPAAQTTSVLFGNARARESATAKFSHHALGEDYRLVTWSQYGNPLWFGGHISGSIISIEQITVDESGGDIQLIYKVVQGETVNISREQRIAQIFNLTPLVFP
jgi:hypothetical protein